jgi:hypothetical protein
MGRGTGQAAEIARPSDIRTGGVENGGHGFRWIAQSRRSPGLSPTVAVDPNRSFDAIGLDGKPRPLRDL